MKKTIASIKIYLLSLLLFNCSAPSDLDQIMKGGSKAFQETLNNPTSEIQIIYGEIKEDTIIHHHYQVEDKKYFYPASTVKMLTAFAAVQRLSNDSMGVSSKIFVDSTEWHPRKLEYDSLFKEKYSIENLLRKIFIFSDNQANNILYGWLGKDYINMTYDAIGLKTRIVHQLAEKAFSFSEEANSTTNAVELFYNETTEDTLLDVGVIIRDFPEQQVWTSDIVPMEQLKGKGYLDKEGVLVQEPFDFSKKNFVPLQSLLESLERIIKPNLFSAKEQFKISSENRKKLLQIMSERPSSLPAPLDSLPDNYVKFFLYGDSNKSNYPDKIVIRNKVGWAYGYLLDIAYIQDVENDIDFFLAAVIHVNANEIYNDGIYEYEEVGLPFLAELGRLVYNFELKKKKK